MPKDRNLKLTGKHDEKISESHSIRSLDSDKAVSSSVESFRKPAIPANGQSASVEANAVNNSVTPEYGEVTVERPSTFIGENAEAPKKFRQIKNFQQNPTRDAVAMREQQYYSYGGNRYSETGEQAQTGSHQVGRQVNMSDNFSLRSDSERLQYSENRSFLQNRGYNIEEMSQEQITHAAQTGKINGRDISYTEQQAFQKYQSEMNAYSSNNGSSASSEDIYQRSIKGEPGTTSSVGSSQNLGRRLRVPSERSEYANNSMQNYPGSNAYEPDYQFGEAAQADSGSRIIDRHAESGRHIVEQSEAGSHIIEPSENSRGNINVVDKSQSAYDGSRIMDGDAKSSIRSLQNNSSGMRTVTPEEMGNRFGRGAQTAPGSEQGTINGGVRGQSVSGQTSQVSGQRFLQNYRAQMHDVIHGNGAQNTDIAASREAAYRQNSQTSGRSIKSEVSSKRDILHQANNRNINGLNKNDIKIANTAKSGSGGASNQVAGKRRLVLKDGKISSQIETLPKAPESGTQAYYKARDLASGRITKNADGFSIETSQQSLGEAPNTSKFDANNALSGTRKAESTALNKSADGRTVKSVKTEAELDPTKNMNPRDRMLKVKHYGENDASSLKLSDRNSISGKSPLRSEKMVVRSAGVKEGGLAEKIKGKATGKMGDKATARKMWLKGQRARAAKINAGANAGGGLRGFFNSVAQSFSNLAAGIGKTGVSIGLVGALTLTTVTTTVTPIYDQYVMTPLASMYYTDGTPQTDNEARKNKEEIFSNGTPKWRETDAEEKILITEAAVEAMKKWQDDWQKSYGVSTYKETYSFNGALAYGDGEDVGYGGNRPGSFRSYYSSDGGSMPSYMTGERYCYQVVYHDSVYPETYAQNVYLHTMGYDNRGQQKFPEGDKRNEAYAYLHQVLGFQKFTENPEEGDYIIGWATSAANAKAGKVAFSTYQGFDTLRGDWVIDSLKSLSSGGRIDLYAVWNVKRTMQWDGEIDLPTAEEMNDPLVGNNFPTGKAVNVSFVYSDKHGGRFYELNSGSSEDGQETQTDIDYANFNNALFIGDSRTVGLEMYSPIPARASADFFAVTGASNSSLMTATATIGNKTLTLSELLASKKYKRIYIASGVNEIGSNPEAASESFGNLLEMVSYSQPDAKIYIQSNFGVTKQWEQDNASRLGADFNRNIDTYNQYISGYDNGNNIIYLDVAAQFKDEEGYLRTADSGDGLHLTSAASSDWADYLASHVYDVDNGSKNQTGLLSNKGNINQNRFYYSQVELYKIILSMATVATQNDYKHPQAYIDYCLDLLQSCMNVKPPKAVSKRVVLKDTAGTKYGAEYIDEKNGAKYQADGVRVSLSVTVYINCNPYDMMAENTVTGDDIYEGCTFKGWENENDFSWALSYLDMTSREFIEMYQVSMPAIASYMGGFGYAGGKYPNAAYVYNVLVGNGYSREAALGILGNLCRESGGGGDLQPDAENANSGARGIMQDIWGRLEEYAAQYGEKWPNISIATQTLALMDMLEKDWSTDGKARGVYPDIDFDYWSLANFKQIDDVDTAAILFQAKYERNGHYGAAGDTDLRIQYAHMFEEELLYVIGGVPDYVAVAMRLADDDRHGYSQPRHLSFVDDPENCDFNCVSFVYYCLYEAGWDVGPVTNGSHHPTDYLSEANGFVKMPFTCQDALVPGDILVLPYNNGEYCNHTEIYVGNGYTTVGAHDDEPSGSYPNRSPEPGDQDHEVCYYEDWFDENQWVWVFRPMSPFAPLDNGGRGKLVSASTIEFFSDSYEIDGYKPGKCASGYNSGNLAVGMASSTSPDLPLGTLIYVETQASGNASAANGKYYLITGKWGPGDGTVLIYRPVANSEAELLNEPYGSFDNAKIYIASAAKVPWTRYLAEYKNKKLTPVGN